MYILCFFFLQNRLKLRSIRITNPITRASSTGNLSKLSLSLVTLYEMMVYDAHTFIVSWFYETTTCFLSCIKISNSTPIKVIEKSLFACYKNKTTTYTLNIIFHKRTIGQMSLMTSFCASSHYFITLNIATKIIFFFCFEFFDFILQIYTKKKVQKKLSVKFC